MRIILPILAIISLSMVSVSATARVAVSVDECGDEVRAAEIEDILALEHDDSERVDRIEIRCTETTDIEVFTTDQSLTRRIATDQIPANGVARFLALNAAEMIEIFTRPAADPEPTSEPEPRQKPVADIVAAEVVTPREPEYDRWKLHVAGLARFDLGAPTPAGGFAIEFEYALAESLRIATDFQTATASSDVSGQLADQLFLASAVKAGYAVDGARFTALWRFGGVQIVRDATDSSGWAFWGGPALSAGYRVSIAGPLMIDGSTEVGYSPWTWGARFDGEDAFRTQNLWFAAQLGLTLSY